MMVFFLHTGRFALCSSSILFRIDYVLTYPAKHFLRNDIKYYSPVQESANDKIESFQQNSEKSVKKTKVYYVNNTRIEIEI